MEQNIQVKENSSVQWFNSFIEKFKSFELLHIDNYYTTYNLIDNPVLLQLINFYSCPREYSLPFWFKRKIKEKDLIEKSLKKTWNR